MLTAAPDTDGMQGAGRIYHRPDGTLVWEPLENGGDEADCRWALARQEN